MSQSQPLTRAGRQMLNRRGFLGDFATGLGSIALAGLLSREGLLAAEGAASGEGATPRADASLAPRAPHFAPRAKQVLMIFCSGACSQLETWDFKPELLKRDGQPMPG
ncbi:MAG TPA: DUF1501 domain-containing protein, partial [Pirellulales bacterium]